MKSLKNRTIGFYIRAAIPLLCLVSLVAYLVYASALGKYDVKSNTGVRNRMRSEYSTIFGLKQVS